MRRALRVHIRWMIRRDMPEVMEIESAGFDFAWTEEEFIRCLRMRNCIGMVAESGEKIVGFMIYELWKTRLHILNFAVHPDYRYRRIGQQMFAKLCGKLSPLRRTRITMDIHESNLDAQLFFQACGARATKVVRDFYDGYGGDAYVMEINVDEAESTVLAKVLQ